MSKPKAELTSVTGYMVDKSSSSLDLTPAFGFFSSMLFGVTGADSSINDRTRKFSQEFRLDLPITAKA